ncbi:hypothetical protein KEM55_003848, partial [Ascosphaera atra]
MRVKTSTVSDLINPALYEGAQEPSEVLESVFYESDLEVAGKEAEEEEDSHPPKRRRRCRLAVREELLSKEVAAEIQMRTELRWRYLTTFSRGNLEKLLKETYPDVKEGNYRIDTFVNRLQILSRDWKCTSLKRMK